MAGTVLYRYTAVVGADGTFSYSVKFAMGGTDMNGVSASGTYTVEGDKFTFTDADGNKTEGVLTADNTLKISLKASPMATAPYEVTFTVPAAE
jgi:homoaconitase/3-isopropylmalate dehydratase large subunit